MNERIQQLAEQAGLKHHNWITNESNVKDGNFKYPRLEDYEKFAELIVRECIQVGGPEDSYTDDWFKAKADSINKIKQHFGVEE